MSKRRIDTDGLGASNVLLEIYDEDEHGQADEADKQERRERLGQ